MYEHKRARLAPNLPIGRSPAPVWPGESHSPSCGHGIKGRSGLHPISWTGRLRGGAHLTGSAKLSNSVPVHLAPNHTIGRRPAPVWPGESHSAALDHGRKREGDPDAPNAPRGFDYVGSQLQQVSPRPEGTRSGIPTPPPLPIRDGIASVDL